MHPDDATAAGVAEGGEARVRSAQGNLVLPVAVDADLPKGVAVASHNLGEQPLGDLLEPGVSVTAARIEPL
jgi:anaerobic selenocysteine-containing dehydrogenase